jgi:hypothetical protein
LKKILVAALAALMVVAGAAVALAQSAAPPKLTVTVKPAKAGTKKKPKNSSIHFVVVNNETNRTLSKLTITMPKTLRMSGKGFKTCSKAFVEQNTAARCPKGSKIGGGTADAILGVNGPPSGQSKFTLTVDAVVGNAKTVYFYLGPPANSVSVGKVKGRKLIISVPPAAQQPITGVYAGLVKLDSTLKGKAKKHFLISSVGCKGGKDPFKAALTFANNGVSPAGTVVVNGSAKCRK